MAEDEQYHDDFELADLDGLDKSSTETTEVPAEETQSAADTILQKFKNLNTRKNAMIALSTMVFLIVILRFISGHADQKNDDGKLVAAVATNPAPLQAPQVPVQQPMQSPPPVVDNKVSQKLSALELTQQSMRDDMNTFNTQLSGINSNMNEMMTKFSEIAKVVANLNAISTAQSQEIERLVTQKVKKHKPKAKVLKAQQSHYYIQAVIPGRAWLVAENGDTITVRVGSPIAKCGVVKMIDPIQGRVMTSSGQIIRFNQADS